MRFLVTEKDDCELRRLCAAHSNRALMALR